ncbi:MAG: hypothetical protein GY820_35525 [Gammaproteobacteria bacterium]|nr:hypothetical protein [Gammaproteobacteria bacterium]
MIGKMSESLKRQSKPLADIKSKYQENVSFDLIDIDNYRKSKSKKHLMRLADSIANNGLLQEPGLVEKPDGRYELAFGQCRVLACRDYNNMTTLPRAKVWPRAALHYIKTIALIENMEREDTSLVDELNGIDEVLKSEYEAFDNPIIGFCEQTGRNIDEIRNKMRILEAMRENSNIKKIVEEQIVVDYKSIYNLAIALETVDNAARQKRVDEFVSKVLKNKVIGNMRVATEKIRQYAKGKIDATALPASVTGKTDTVEPGKRGAIGKKAVITSATVLKFGEKLSALEGELSPELQVELKKIHTQIGEKIQGI